MRFPDWQIRLQKCIQDRSAIPFSWGAQDCGLFAADCVEAISGRDPAHGLRSTYSDARGAAKILKNGLRQIASERFGQEISPMMAQPGDVGLLPNDGRECLAIWGGSAWHAPTDNGLAAYPLEFAITAWRFE